jgi:hypothetical protein
LDVDHGVVEVFAYQETLLLMAVFGVAILTMMWVAFRRWLQHKENMGRLIAKETAERSAASAAQMERVEARLAQIERIVGDGSVEPAVQMEPGRAKPLPGGLLKADEA